MSKEEMSKTCREDCRAWKEKPKSDYLGFCKRKAPTPTVFWNDEEQDFADVVPAVWWPELDGATPVCCEMLPKTSPSKCTVCGDHGPGVPLRICPECMGVRCKACMAEHDCSNGEDAADKESI